MSSDSFRYESSQGKMESMTINHKEPDICPICKKGIQPKFLYGFANTNRNFLWALYECRACSGVFLKSSSYSEGYTLNENGSYSLTPNPPVNAVFSKYIVSVSTKFVEIYNQASAAENLNFTEIAGIGYRKSIEFLIKDYLLSKVEDGPGADADKDKISRMPLAACITTYVDNPNIKKLASRAVWIGNDETHYIRKHEDRDITDLKRLIDLTVRWIEMELMTAEDIADIQPK